MSWDENDVLKVQVWCHHDPESDIPEERDFHYTAHVVVRGYIRTSYHMEELEALRWAQEMTAMLLIKTAVKES